MDIESTDEVLQAEKMEGSENVNLGVHVYKETVATTISSEDMVDVIYDIFVAYKNNTLPKVTPDETQELLRNWFQGTLCENVGPELHEQSVTSVASDAEQQVRQLFKRQRVDGGV